MIIYIYKYVCIYIYYITIRTIDDVDCYEILFNDNGRICILCLLRRFS